MKRALACACALVAIAVSLSCEERASSGSEEPAGTTPAPQPPEPATVSLAFEETRDEAGEPRSRALLVIATRGAAEQRIDLGVHRGFCSQPSGLVPTPPPLLSATCHLAGSGVELMVRKEGDALVAMKRAYESPSSPAPYETITRVPLPPGTVVTTPPLPG